MRHSPIATNRKVATFCKTGSCCHLRISQGRNVVIYKVLRTTWIKRCLFTQHLRRPLRISGIVCHTPCLHYRSSKQGFDLKNGITHNDVPRKED
jgi:hypothetical protein